MNVLIEQGNWFLQNERKSNGFWKEILTEIKPYIINKIAKEYNRYNLHPHASEIISNKEMNMTILSELQRAQTEKKIAEEQIQLEVKRNQYNQLQQKVNNIPPVINMKQAYAEVQKSKITLNRDYERLTSNRLVV